MALRIVEFFGFEPPSEFARPFVVDSMCPFTRNTCIKPDHGSCSIRQKSGEPIICCPNRLYAENYKALHEIADACFGKGTELVTALEARSRRSDAKLTGHEVVAFGKGFGGELPLPRPKRTDGKASGSYFVDWILAKIGTGGQLEAFTAVEVQTIDTTGNYKEQVREFFKFNGYNGYSKTGGMNWENVNKRILPQLIYKGHALRREPKCEKGLFFVCPHQVYERIVARLGGKLHEYPIGPGTISFRSYKLDDGNPGSDQKKLVFYEQFTTTVDQVALAFTSPMNLPDQGVYAAAIDLALS